ncbi:NYN domain-containing protein [Candidatus Peregrinibacteria bacterium]|nr:NYN domain-containing protein [Candidatus Peregrinibacteria bacterium]
MTKISEKNYAFIDGQNLHMGTLSSEVPWKIDLQRFRVYLAEKYNVTKAYYYLGFTHTDYNSLYRNIQEAGFILEFRKHTLAMRGEKKGNVDTEIVFEIMRKLYKKEHFGKIVLVSGDGDFRMLVDFLIAEGRFQKILFPNKHFASSLYRSLHAKFFSFLEDEGTRRKISWTQKKKGYP